MTEFLSYGTVALLVCFVVTTFLLSKIDSEIVPENYEFKIDPFWYIWGTMLIGCLVCYFYFPSSNDCVNSYSALTIFIPFLFASLIYFSYIIEFNILTDILTFGFALVMSYMTPEGYQLFPAQLSPLQDKLVIALFIYTISKGLGLLNGVSAIASMQFITVFVSVILLVYFGALPQILGVLAMTYIGAMLGFAIFSWPPEKLVMSSGAFSAFGFILGCFMLNGAVEYAEASLFIACSYLFTEVLQFLYRRYIERKFTKQSFMTTSYFLISNNKKYEYDTVIGVGKILVVNVILSIIQIASAERLAFPVFSIALNLWLLSILSGDTKSEELLSVSRWGKNAIKNVLTKKNNSKSRKK